MSPGTNQPGMLPVSNLIMQRTSNPGTGAEPAQNGEQVDLSLLEDSLRLTPWQRLLENERAPELVRMLEAAQPRADGTAEPNS